MLIDWECSKSNMCIKKPYKYVSLIFLLDVWKNILFGELKKRLIFSSEKMEKRRRKSKIPWRVTLLQDVITVVEGHMFLLCNTKV